MTLPKPRLASQRRRMACNILCFMLIFVLPEGSKAVPVAIGSKAGGIGSAAAGQAPPEGENVLTKILQGGAAEQAGKLGDGRFRNHFIFMS